MIWREIVGKVRENNPPHPPGSLGRGDFVAPVSGEIALNSWPYRIPKQICRTAVRTVELTRCESLGGVSFTLRAAPSMQTVCPWAAVKQHRGNPGVNSRPDRGA